MSFMLFDTKIAKFFLQFKQYEEKELACKLQIESNFIFGNIIFISIS